MNRSDHGGLLATFQVGLDVFSLQFQRSEGTKKRRGAFMGWIIGDLTVATFEGFLSGWWNVRLGFGWCSCVSVDRYFFLGGYLTWGVGWPVDQPWTKKHSQFSYRGARAPIRCSSKRCFEVQLKFWSLLVIKGCDCDIFWGIHSIKFVVLVLLVCCSWTWWFWDNIIATSRDFHRICDICGCENPLSTIGFRYLLQGNSWFVVWWHTNLREQVIVNHPKTKCTFTPENRPFCSKKEARSSFPLPPWNSGGFAVNYIVLGSVAWLASWCLEGSDLELLVSQTPFIIGSQGAGFGYGIGWFPYFHTKLLSI